MQAYFASKGKTDFTIVLGRLKETLKCDMSTSIKEMVKKILTLVENDWQQPQTVNTSNIVNPYLNNPQGIIIGAGGDGHHYSDRINNHQYVSFTEILCLNHSYRFCFFFNSLLITKLDMILATVAMKIMPKFVRISKIFSKAPDRIEEFFPVRFVIVNNFFHKPITSIIPGDT